MFIGSKPHIQARHFCVLTCHCHPRRTTKMTSKLQKVHVFKNDHIETYNMSIFGCFFSAICSRCRKNLYSGSGSSSTGTDCTLNEKNTENEPEISVRFLSLLKGDTQMLLFHQVNKGGRDFLPHQFLKNYLLYNDISFTNELT